MDNEVTYANDLATAAETAGANLVNALQDGNSTLAFSEMVNAPSTIMDASAC